MSRSTRRHRLGRPTRFFHVCNVHHGALISSTCAVVDPRCRYGHSRFRQPPLGSCAAMHLRLSTCPTTTPALRPSAAPAKVPPYASVEVPLYSTGRIPHLFWRRTVTISPLSILRSEPSCIAIPGSSGILSDACSQSRLCLSRVFPEFGEAWQHRDWMRWD
ncbi:hypothetical protein P154DRAFT_166056 [Amniculicola lignicola CBS 123094]|uniref:Uncharacterized protein n=1 Tax=Amniculicola lignicola CBS 123094 TaxID=1392246 RepID=A0A6A5WJJ0_9PLEO|nr:hypothetical protein P154DRAFT_166056 [Amniculicola lignicola CBS 123094]